MTVRFSRLGFVRLVVALAFATTFGVAIPAVRGDAAQPQKKVASQAIDQEYTAKIKEYTQDPRILTELVDHLPASATVPSPLKFLGRVAGMPDELTYYKDMKRYFEALAKAAPARTRLFTIGQSEEGRDMIVLAIADEATIKTLDKYKKILADLTDPRKLTEAQAKALIAAGKPIYWATGNLHSGETGSAEMQMELAYRLIVEETPFIQNIRGNEIVFLTPVVEVDGREKVVDNLYYQKKTGQRMPLIWWGQYVAHDNNRDGLGLGLKLTQNVLRTFLEWHPTVLHDLHESQDYLYASTGAGPVQRGGGPGADRRVVADREVRGRRDDQARRARRVDRHVLRRLDAELPVLDREHPQRHRPLLRDGELRAGEPRDHLERQQGVVPAEPAAAAYQVGAEEQRQHPAERAPARDAVRREEPRHVPRELLPEEQARDRAGQERPAVCLGDSGRPAPPRRGRELRQPAARRRRGSAQGDERVHGGRGAGGGRRLPGPDGPARTAAARSSSSTRSSSRPPTRAHTTTRAGRSRSLRNVKVAKIEDKAALDQPMTLLAADAKVPGAISGTGSVIVVDHNGDTSIAPFRFALGRDVKVLAAEAAFDAGGQKFAAGSFIFPAADRAKLEPLIKEYGLAATAVSSVPTVKTHELALPRIGYVHSWSNTQNEGWVRMAFDKLKIPYTYMGDTKLREPNLRQKYDVIIFPHVGGTAESQVNGVQGAQPIPYKKTDLTPNLGVQDSADDIRGGMGFEGLINLMKFVQDGGLLITEGSTSTIFPDYHLVSGVTVEEPTGLFARGVVMKSVFADRNSPIAYGYDSDNLAVYFSQGPVLNAGGAGGFGGGFGGGGGRGGAQIPGVGMNLNPNATPSDVNDA